MKQEYIELAKKILEGKIELEDQLVEMAYQIAAGLEVTPEELETARDEKRAKNLALGNLNDVGSKLMKATKKTDVVEYLGDILEIVETYTATH